MLLTCNLCKGTQYVFEDDKEHEQERDHEGEQKTPYRLTKYQGEFGSGLGGWQCDCGFIQYGQDELFRSNGEKENAPEHGQCFVKQFQPSQFLCARVFQLVAEGRAEDKIGEIGDGEIVGVRNMPKRRGELQREVFTKMEQSLLL